MTDWYNFDKMMQYLKWADDIQLKLLLEQFEQLDTYEKAYAFCKDVRMNCKDIIKNRKLVMEKYTG